VDEGGLAGTDTAAHGNQLSGLAAELRHVESEVILAMVGELGVALGGREEKGRRQAEAATKKEAAVSAQRTKGQKQMVSRLSAAR
jgi:hypothetical protein